MGIRIAVHFFSSKYIKILPCVKNDVGAIFKPLDVQEYIHEKQVGTCKVWSQLI